jgi:hypothetical protein
MGPTALRYQCLAANTEAPPCVSRRIEAKILNELLKGLYFEIRASSFNTFVEIPGFGKKQQLRRKETWGNGPI